MSTQVLEQTEAAVGSGLPIYRFNVEQYLKMIVAGVFPDGARVELLSGVVVSKMTKYTPHNYSVMMLGACLRPILPSDWIIREEKSIVLGYNWRPEPDLVVARGPYARYARADPNAADLALIAEIADSSVAEDRGLKWRQYAATGIPSYWILQIKQARVDVFTDPTGRGESANYQTSTTYARGQEIPVVIDGVEVGRIAVNDLFA